MRIGLSIIAIIASLGVRTQAPTTFQLFIPGGALPAREIRFTLAIDDEPEETLLTDAKGQYQLTVDPARNREYVIVIEGDRRAYDTTRLRFRIMGRVSFVPIFLRPLNGRVPPPKEVVEVSANDAKVPAGAKAAYEQAMKAASENNLETAISEYTRALSLYPRYLQALNELGDLFLKLGRLDQAVSTLTQALSLNSEFYFARLKLGAAYNRQAKFDEAIRVLDKLVKEQPTITLARIQLAEALLASRQTDASIEQLRLALADRNLESSVRAGAHLSLGFLLNREERYAAAAAELEKSIMIDPKVARAHMYLGVALFNLKKMAEAEATLQKAIELGGKDGAGAQFFLGQIYYLQQKFDLSQRAFEQYLKDMPNATNAAQVRELVEKIKAARGNK